MDAFDFKTEFAHNLQGLMDEQNITLSELSRKTGISKTEIHFYLHQKRMPSVLAFINIAIALNCDLNDLISIYY
jgi:transcriptional regulator with XRE-family HTH domain